MILKKLIKNFKHFPTFVFYLLTLYYCVRSANSNWVFKAGSQLNFPGHFYKINCSRGETLTINAQWFQAADLDLFIYKQNANLLSNSYISSSTSSSTSGENMTYYVTSSAIYYVKVKTYNLYSLNSLDYTISISSSWGSNYQYDAMISSYNPSMPATSFTKTSNDGCALKIQFTPQNSLYGTSLKLISPMGTQYVFYQTNSSSLNQFQASQFQQVGTWTLIFINSMSSTTILYPFMYNIYYDDNTNLCQSSNTQINNTTNSPNIIIIIVVVSSVVVIGIFIGVCIYFKKCRNRNLVKLNQQNNDNLQLQDTSQEIKQQRQNISCPICLDTKCDATLKCKHSFHKNCIQNWFKKNKNCPLCRAEMNSRIMAGAN